MWRQPENQSSCWDLSPIYGAQQADVSLISTFGIRVKNYFEVDNRDRDPAHNTFIFPS